MASAEKDNLGADLSAYLDGEFNNERAREIEKTLAESADARGTLDGLRSISEQLGTLPRKSAPRELTESLRRSAEQHALLQQQPTLGRLKVIRFVAQIAACAAVVTLCVVVGWGTLRQAETPPTAAESVIVEDKAGEKGPWAAEQRAVRAERRGVVQHDETAETVAEPADHGLPIAALDRLEALGYVGGADADFDADASSDAVTPEPTSTVVSTAEAERQSEPLMFTDAGPPSAALTPPVDDLAGPAINVVVATRTDGEFLGARSTIARLQRAEWGSDAMADRSGAAGSRLGRAGLDTSSSPRTAEEFVLAIPEEQLGLVLASLDREAPDQVQVVLNFKADEFGQIQRMVAAPEVPAQRARGQFASGSSAAPEKRGKLGEVAVSKATPAALESETPPPDGQRRTGRGGGGRVVRSLDVEAGDISAERMTDKKGPPTSQATTLERAGEEIYAYRLPSNGQFRAQRRAISGDATGGRRGAAMGTSGPSEDAERQLDYQRQPHVDDVAANMRHRLAEAAAADEDERTTPAASPSLRAQLASLWDFLLGDGPRENEVAQRIQPAPETQAAPLKLRVLLLPPPAGDSATESAVPCTESTE